MNERDKLFSFLLSFYFFSFLIIFFLFLHFRCYSPDCHSFFYSIPFKIFSLIAPSFIKSSFYLFIMFFLFVILIFLIIAFVLFYFILPDLQPLIFANFSLSFIWNFVLLCYPFSFPKYFLYLFCVFHFSKLLFFFYSSILLKHAAILIERFWQTCMTKEQSEMRLIHPFARPYVVRTDRNPLFCATWFWHWNFHIVLARPCVGITANFSFKWKKMNWSYWTL